MMLDPPRRTSWT